MPHEDLAERLHSAAIHLLRRVATVDARAGLSPARHSALAVIVDRGPLTMTDLARIEQVSPATASSTVCGLEAAVLVARRKRGEKRPYELADHLPSFPTSNSPFFLPRGAARPRWV